MLPLLPCSSKAVPQPPQEVEQPLLEVLLPQEEPQPLLEVPQQPVVASEPLLAPLPASVAVPWPVEPCATQRATRWEVASSSRCSSSARR